MVGCCGKWWRRGQLRWHRRMKRGLTYEPRMSVIGKREGESGETRNLEEEVHSTNNAKGAWVY
jgi:hypothetical protein